MFFEGPEKKVELLVRPGSHDLRSFGDAFWGKIVEAAQAKILSKISTPTADAYLLSESSLFVNRDRITMITCGRTVLVKAVEALLRHVPISDVDLFVYERKNEHFPQDQHSTFEQDTAFLQKLLPGQSICFGRDHGHHIMLYALCKPFTPVPQDMTLEILMHGLSEESRAMFQKGPKRNLDFIRKKSGIWEILPNFKVDDYLFKPMGYSLNAVRDDLYYTFHITPQEVGSYASFETNFPFDRDPTEIVERVLALFKPKECNVLFFQPAGKNIMRFAQPPRGFELRSQRTERLDCSFQVEFFDYTEETP